MQFTHHLYTQYDDLSLSIHSARSHFMNYSFRWLHDIRTTVPHIQSPFIPDSPSYSSSDIQTLLSLRHVQKRENTPDALCTDWCFVNHFSMISCAANRWCSESSKNGSSLKIIPTRNAYTYSLLYPHVGPLTQLTVGSTPPSSLGECSKFHMLLQFRSPLLYPISGIVKLCSQELQFQIA